MQGCLHERHPTELQLINQAIINRANVLICNKKEVHFEGQVQV